MEDKTAKQIIAAFADSRINPAHVAWLVKMGANGVTDKHLKEFFYYYTIFRKQDLDAADAEWLGDKILSEMRNPEMEGLSNPPPPGTRIVFADEM